MSDRYYEDKRIYCYICRKYTIFHRRDSKNNIGVECHCGECSGVWFEWQNRAVERELEKWIEYNTERFSRKPYLDYDRNNSLKSIQIL